MTIVGPLFWKELIESSRRIRYFAVRSIVAAVVLTTLMSLSPPLAKNEVSQLAAIGRQLLEQWAWVQLIALVLFVPAFTSGLIAGEKENKTIDALFTTCLSDREILWGKLASRLFATGVIIASSLPVIVLLSFLGGFGPKEVMDYALLHAATALLCAAVGLYYSVISSKPYVALIRAYFVLLVAWMLTLWIVPSSGSWWGPPVFVGGVRMSLGDAYRVGMAIINPFLWLRQRDATGALGLAWSPPVYGYVFVAVVVSFLLMRRAHRVLRVSVSRQHSPRLWRWMNGTYRWIVDRAGRSLEQRGDRGFWAAIWDWEKKSRLWGSWERQYGLQINPLFFRRAAANVYDPERYIAGVQVLCWVVVLGLVFTGAYLWNDLIIDPENFAVILAIELPLLALVFVILTASSIAREADRGSLDILTLTTLTPGEMLVGTTWGVFRTAWPMLTLVAITMLFGAVATLREHALLTWLFTLPPMLASLVAGSLLISVVAQRTLMAITAALTAPIFFVAIPTILDMLGILHGPAIVYVVVLFSVLLLTLRLFNRRRSLPLAMMLIIALPLLCMLVAFHVGACWETTSRWGSGGPWANVNYARWMLEALFESRGYNFPYSGDRSRAAVLFAIAQLVAAAWLLALARKNLALMFGDQRFRLEPEPEPLRGFETIRPAAPQPLLGQRPNA